MFMDLNSKVFFNFCVSLFISQSRTGVLCHRVARWFHRGSQSFFLFHRVPRWLHGGSQSFFCFSRWDTVYYSVEHCGTFFHGGLCHRVSRWLHGVSQSFFLFFTVLHCVLLCGTLWNFVSQSRTEFSQRLTEYFLFHCGTLCITLWNTVKHFFR
jgi:hypothetical protein